MAGVVMAGEDNANAAGKEARTAGRATHPDADQPWPFSIGKAVTEVRSFFRHFKRLLHTEEFHFSAGTKALQRSVSAASFHPSPGVQFN